MKNTVDSIFIFCLYTLFIYYFSTIMGILVGLFLFDGKTFREILIMIINLIYFGVKILFAPIIEPFYIYPFHEWLEVFIMCICLICLYILYATPFIFWCIKQTLFRAFLVSLLGLVAGPGIVFFLLIAREGESGGDSDNKPGVSGLSAAVYRQ